MSQSNKIKIALGSDHAGWQLKNQIKQYLEENGHYVSDFGTYSADSCDYADFAYPTAKSVGEGVCQRGIVVCFTGIGVSIVANKVKGVRCALCHNSDSAKLTRQHNDSNVLAIGSKYTDFAESKELVEIFLSTPFEGGRHEKRINKISEIEKNFRGEQQ